MTDDERRQRVQAHYARLRSQTLTNAPAWFGAYIDQTVQRTQASTTFTTSDFNPFSQALAQLGYQTLSQVYVVRPRDDDPTPPAHCCVCRTVGPGVTELPDGRLIHRWPCRDRLL